MLLSRKLLCELSPSFANVSDEKLKEGVMNMGMEVEQIIHHPEINNLCVGKIIKLSNHPKSQKLHVVEVLINEQKQIVKTIICGAPNVFEGQKVVVATSGAKLYDGREILDKELQGIMSCGMLCGYSELTPYGNEFLTDVDQKGIITLDTDAKIGATNIAEILGLNDTIYDLSVPSNRHDWQSLLLLVSDMTKFFDFKTEIETAKILKSKIESLYELNIDKEISTNATIYKLNSIDNSSTPWELRIKLINSGVKLVNKTIDLISYITLLTGVAPVIADGDKLPKVLKQKMGNGGAIIIDGKQCKVGNKDAIIVDEQNNIVALDNIACNDKYAIDANTKTIVLYISDSQHDLIRNTMTRYNLSSKSGKSNSKRSNGYQMNMFNTYVNNIFKDNVVQACNNQIAIESNKTIKCNIDELVKFNGMVESNAKEFAINSLTKLGYKVNNNEVTVPGYRYDLTNDQDIFEEVLKVYGINNLPVLPYTHAIDLLFKNDANYNKLSSIKTLLTNAYITESKTYNLTTKEKADVFNFFNLKPIYHLVPCTNKAREYMRIELLTNMLSVFEYNLNRKNTLQPIFEIQKIFTEETNTNLTILAPETYTIDSLNNVVLNFNTSSLRNIANAVAKNLNTEISIEVVSDCPYLYANDALKITYNNKTIGYIGCIKQKMLNPYKISQSIYALTMNLEDLLKDSKDKKTLKVKDIDDATPVIKDLTFNATKNTNIFAILKSLDKLDVIKEYSFIKVYHIDDETIAYTIRFSIKNNNQQSLTKNDIDRVIKQIAEIILSNNAEIKGI